MSIVGCAFFHTLLLAVPTNLHHVDYPHTSMSMENSDVNLRWQPCHQEDGAENTCTTIR